MKCETPALASVSSREPAPIQKPRATERTLGTLSEMTRSPESSSERTYFCTPTLSWPGAMEGDPTRFVELTCRAPGRVNLIGEHTDYSGGLVLPVAIDRGIRLECRPGPRIALVSDGDAIALSADGGGDARGWGRYVAGVAQELAALGRPAVGIEGSLRSNLPQGAGLGSSGALEVVVASALCTVAEFEVEPLELALACQRAERRAVGVPSGILSTRRPPCSAAKGMP